MKEKWLRSTLGDICTKITDGSHWSPKSIAQGIPMASVKDMADYGFNIESCKKISDEDYQELIKNDCKPLIDDVLIAKDGSYLKHVFVWRNDIDIAILSSIAILRPNKEIVKPNFLAKYLTSPIIKKAMSGYVTGAALPRIILKDFIKFRVLLPPLHIQRKIASILSVYDDLIENNSRRIKILEEMAQAIYQEWFVKFRFPGHKKIRMVDSPLGKIPEGWNVTKIGESFTVILGGTPARNKPEYWGGNINWINSGKVNDLRVIDKSEGITELGLKKSATKLMPIRTTVLAITGATLGQVSLTEIEVCSNQSVVGVYDEQQLYSEYLYLKITEIIQKMIMKAGGGAQQHINKEIVSQSKALLPDKQIMADFNGIIRPVFNEISNLLFKNQNLRKTRDLLLPRLISGEIDVEDLDIDVGELAE